PCEGACASGEICNVDTNQCETPAPTGLDPTCAQSCSTGSLLVYSQPDSMIFEACCAATCACEALPDIPTGSTGSYADAGLHGDTLYVSAYNSMYGDLVVNEYNKDSLART